MSFDAIDREGRKLPIRLAVGTATAYRAKIPTPPGCTDGWSLGKTRQLAGMRIVPIVGIEPRVTDLDSSDRRLNVFVAMVYYVQLDPPYVGRIWVAELRGLYGFQYFKIDPDGFPSNEGIRHFVVLDDLEARSWLGANGWAAGVAAVADASKPPADLRDSPSADRLTPGAKAIGAALDIQREGGNVSLKGACERAGVDRGHVRKRYPEAVEAIRAIGRADRSPRRGTRELRTGDIDGVVEGDED